MAQGTSPESDTVAVCSLHTLLGMSCFSPTFSVATICRAVSYIVSLIIDC